MGDSKEQEEKKEHDTSVSRLLFKGTAYQTIQSIVLHHAIRNDHTTFSGKLPPLRTSEPDSSGVTVTSSSLSPPVLIDKRNLHHLHVIIDHPVHSYSNPRISVHLQ